MRGAVVRNLGLLQAVLVAAVLAACGSQNSAATAPTSKVCQNIVRAASNTKNPLYEQAAWVLVHGCVAIAHQHDMGNQITKAQARSLAEDYLQRAGITAAASRTLASSSTTETTSTSTAPSGPSQAGTSCGESITVNSVTSCSFAMAVATSYTSTYPSGGGGDVTAQSPVTHQTYTMHCVQHGGQVQCDGGTNAQLTFSFAAAGPAPSTSSSAELDPNTCYPIPARLDDGGSGSGCPAGQDTPSQVIQDVGCFGVGGATPRQAIVTPMCQGNHVQTFGISCQKLQVLQGLWTPACYVKPTPWP